MALQPLTAGELRSRIRVEAESKVPNGQGGFTSDWSPVVIVWAKKVPLRGDEMTREGDQQGGNPRVPRGPGRQHQGAARPG
ncbi:head-tail adaptor protein [Novosphingobium sp. FGD1]|uniref:Head-tail adaptor protein n=1 Tax=Novosphingobium silvae TaxID=2692619 RepID=A0A7X4GJ29_9SPHN|nr:head-tail adaptor protein [Novosphingobium silvae]